MTATIIVNIVSRWGSDKVLFSTTLPADTPEAAQMRMVVEQAVASRANLTRANLTGADLTGANLTGANLTRANLTRANLYGANLTDASLTDANLTGANLYGADLTGANLTGANLTGATYRDTTLGARGLLKMASRSDGYTFMFFDCADGVPRISAGCRWFTADEAFRHWRDGPRGGTDLGIESLDIVALFRNHWNRINKP
jgi:hypothetical protein